MQFPFPFLIIETANSHASKLTCSDHVISVYKAIFKITKFSSQKSEFCLSKKREAQIGTPRRLKADIPLESRCADPLESRFADPLKVESSVEEEDRVKKEHELQV